MPTIVWAIVGVGFVAPAVAILALVLANRFSKGSPGRAINAFWAVLAVLLAGFLGYGLLSR
ncbi:hypothetical protein J2Z79_000648 [Symbiobacterium terraclitae]|uniref:Cardiolipin synthase N-terminal domain-containing protein n=1 Tax=Symbiobacterium terraclitae TaxID=557451 RepID=A0ABS4JP10_9FIRM|nr:hypothetical protein [Symbiobacterium terraclitae]MBP2017274.1 hypothetical protein [Symbiobacterium terraclitae]